MNRPTRLAAGLFAALSLLFAQAPQPAAPAPPAQDVPGMSFDGAALSDVIKLLAGELKINIAIDPAIKGGTVIVNTYGTVHDTDLRPLLETILRMNNLAMVQVGNMYRIVPAAGVARQPVNPISQSDPNQMPDDERLVLNLVFLRYMNSGEMARILDPFKGDGAQITNYDPANLLIILDNSRNMRRTLELINTFDSESFAGQRVRAFELKNGSPENVVKELEDVFRAYAFSSSGKAGGSVQFVPLDRISTILAVAPNPGVFAEVESWIAKLDIPAKASAGSVGNHVYTLKYGRAENLGTVIMQLYGQQVSYNNTGANNGLYGGTSGVAGLSGGGALGQSGLSPGSTGGAIGSGPFGMNAQNSGVAGGLAGISPTGQTGTNPALGAANQTGMYMGAGTGAFRSTGLPRIIPNIMSNTLLVQSTPEDWEQIRTLLDQLDISPRQVLIDARIYEVNLTGDFSAGVQAYLQKRGTTNAAGITQHQLTGANSAINTILSAGSMVGQSRELLAVLQANEMTTKAKVISAPSVIATDSIPASITVGSTVPTLSSQAVNPGVTSGGNSVFTNTISNTNTGVGLNILARVNASGIVTMVIDQSVTAPVATTSSTINSPSFSDREVSTQVTVQDGDTIAIGGIIDESNTETSSGIPILDRIPYLGAVFGSKSYSKQRTELIIFLTPHVIYDTNQIADATAELKQKVKGLRKMIQQDPSAHSAGKP